MPTVTANKVWVSGETVLPEGLNLTAAPTVVLADGEVTTAKIADSNVTTLKIADANVTTLKIADSNVTAAKLASNAVETAKIADDAVTNDKLSLAANAGEVKKALNADNAPPIYACRAWVNFDGQTAANLGGNYTRTGTDVTITATAHGLIANNVVRLDFTGGSPTSAADGTYTVTQVDDANTFHVTTSATGTSSGGTVDLLRRSIRGSGNVGSVTYLNAAGQYAINFSVAMPDGNYAVTAGGRTFATVINDSPLPTAAAFYVLAYNSTPTLTDDGITTLAIIR